MSVILRMISRFRLIFMMGQTVEEVERKMHGFRVKIVVVNCRNPKQPETIDAFQPQYISCGCRFNLTTCYIVTDGKNIYTEDYVLSHKKDFIVHRWFEY